MDRFEKVLVLDTEVQAQLVGGVLADRRIPHILHSYYDSALDGLWQGMKGWGHIEAPPAYHDEIRAIVGELERQSGAPGPDRAPDEGQPS